MRQDIPCAPHSRSGGIPAVRAGALVLAVVLCGAAGVAGGAGTAPVEAIPEALPGAPPFPDALRKQLAAALAARGSGYEPRTRHRLAGGAPHYTNRLLLEKSPYLLQHAHNPVDWHPWGDAAFETARRLDRPVLVSIGYSTCHWCHVMEEESFDDPEIATLLNRHFVAIKVDRERRPEVDATYLAAASAMDSPTGWPLNVFVMPDRRPFFAGTYFPREDAPGRPGFSRVLAGVAEQWQARREPLDQIAAQVTERLEAQEEALAAESSRLPDATPIVRAVDFYAARFDPREGGLIGRTRFPSSLPIPLLLRYQRRSGDAGALEMATLTLERMASGGLRDHVGGGFHRYTTDPAWKVPHFEKMLYDNARLAVAYLEAWQATGRDDFAEVVRDTLDYVAREMTAPGGGFYSATDADSRDAGGEREEGRYYTWTPAEVDAALGPEHGRIARAWYGVSEAGDLEGRSVLRVTRSVEDVARALEIEPDAVRAALPEIRRGLAVAREKRRPPERDEKIVTAWNGLTISAFARAGFALEVPEWIARAERAADFALAQRSAEGHLRRIHFEGQATGPAFLEDYALLIASLLDLYEAAPDPRWLREARALQALLDEHYADAWGGYFQTAADQSAPLVRQKPSRDAALPSGNSVAALNLLRLAQILMDDAHRARALMLFSAFQRVLDDQPSRMPELLVALDYELDTTKEVIVVRPPRESADRLLAPLRSRFVPNRILAVVAEGEDLGRHAPLVPLVRGRIARGGRPTAYVCENQICSFPTADPEVFAKQITRVERYELPEPGP